MKVGLPPGSTKGSIVPRRSMRIGLPPRGTYNDFRDQTNKRKRKGHNNERGKTYFKGVYPKSMEAGMLRRASSREQSNIQLATRVILASILSIREVLRGTSSVYSNSSGNRSLIVVDQGPRWWVPSLIRRRYRPRRYRNQLLSSQTSQPFQSMHSFVQSKHEKRCQMEFALQMARVD